MAQDGGAVALQRGVIHVDFVLRAVSALTKRKRASSAPLLQTKPHKAHHGSAWRKVNVKMSWRVN